MSRAKGTFYYYLPMIPNCPGLTVPPSVDTGYLVFPRGCGGLTREIENQIDLAIQE